MSIEAELLAMTAQKERWEKVMLETGLSASEMTAYSRLRTELEILNIKKVSITAARPNLPSYDDDEDDVIPFSKAH